MVPGILCSGGTPTLQRKTEQFYGISYQDSVPGFALLNCQERDGTEVLKKTRSRSGTSSISSEQQQQQQQQKHKRCKHSSGSRVFQDTKDRLSIMQEQMKIRRRPDEVSMDSNSGSSWDGESEKIGEYESSLVPVPATNVVKPVAMKVVRPIPKHASEQFYNEAYLEGLTLKETNEAAMIAHDWHRKWTQQDEHDHTMPNANAQEGQCGLPGHYAFDIDRDGAMNPYLDSTDSSANEDMGKRSLGGVLASEEEHKMFLFNPDDRLTGSSCSEHEIVFFNPGDQLSGSSCSATSYASSLSSCQVPNAKRRYVAQHVQEEENRDVQSAVRPTVFRPSAMRPAFIHPEIPSTNYLNGDVPEQVTATRESNVSPMSSSLLSSLAPGTPPVFTPIVQPTVVNVVEDYDTVSSDACPESVKCPSSEIEMAKDEVLSSLAASQGDVDSPNFKDSLNPLLKYFSKTELDTRPHLVGDSDSVDGMWLSLSKPSYFGCLGENDAGDPMYTLGRMAFDMFSPTNLVCSLQGNFNPVEVVSDEERKAMLQNVPKGLREEVESGSTVLRTYHIVAAFTIEPALAEFPDAPNKDVSRPIKGIMTTYGYSLPDPDVSNRHSIWFTGGRIEPNNNLKDIEAWKRLFTLHPPSHTWGEKAKLLAVKLLMGATVPDSMAQDGSMEYAFTRPLGGHGMAYMDVIYLDETMRIVRGHRGTIFVFSRLPEGRNQ